jgi:hypothetical protein
MTGQRDEALLVLAKCLEFEPNNREVQARIKEFGG